MKGKRMNEASREIKRLATPSISSSSSARVEQNQLLNECTRPRQPPISINMESFYSGRDHTSKYFYLLHGSPQKADWDKIKLVELIMDRLEVPQNIVLRVLNKLIENEKVDDFDPNAMKYKTQAGSR